MLKWEERPFEISFNLNPAFLSILLYEATFAFKEEKNEGIPYSLVILVIPIVFYNPIREKLPTRVFLPLYSWVEKNPDILIKLPQLIIQSMPYIKEAIIFSLQKNVLTFDKKGDLVTTKKINKQLIDDLQWDKESKTHDMRVKAKLLGKWLAKSGDVEVIYRTLGIQP